MWLERVIYSNAKLDGKQVTGTVTGITIQV